jgi:hypothetical protein
MEEEKKECCGKEGCDCKSCCGSSCCCKKALMVLVLLLLGGILGYLGGTRQFCGRMTCPMGMMATPPPPPAK